MRQRRRPSGFRYPRLCLPVGLSVLSLFFAGGILLGCFVARSVSGEDRSVLALYVDGYLSAARTQVPASPELVSLFWETFRWPVGVFLLSFTAVGIVGIPAIFLIRGFLLSFAVSSFVGALGKEGIILAFALFGVTGLFSLPVLFMLGSQGMTICQSLAAGLLGKRRKKPIFHKTYFRNCGFCTVALMICVCLEQKLVPALLLFMANAFQ